MRRNAVRSRTGLSAIRPEDCPPCRRNSVRHHSGIVSAMAGMRSRRVFQRYDSRQGLCDGRNSST